MFVEVCYSSNRTLTQRPRGQRSSLPCPDLRLTSRQRPHGAPHLPKPVPTWKTQDVQGPDKSSYFSSFLSSSALDFMDMLSPAHCSPGPEEAGWARLSPWPSAAGKALRPSHEDDSYDRLCRGPTDGRNPGSLTLDALPPGSRL